MFNCWKSKDTESMSGKQFAEHMLSVMFKLRLNKTFKELINERAQFRWFGILGMRKHLTEDEYALMIDLNDIVEIHPDADFTDYSNFLSRNAPTQQSVQSILDVMEANRGGSVIFYQIWPQWESLVTAQQMADEGFIPPLPPLPAMPLSLVTPPPDMSLPPTE